MTPFERTTAKVAYHFFQAAEDYTLMGGARDPELRDLIEVDMLALCLEDDGDSRLCPADALRSADTANTQRRSREVIVEAGRIDSTEERIDRDVSERRGET